MRAIALVAAFAACASFLNADSARADGLIQSLPPDGSSVRYKCVVEQWRNGGVFSRSEGTLTIRSVGVTEEENVRCRWIDFEVRLRDSNTKHESTDIRKYLLPEESLDRTGDPLSAVVRCWGTWGSTQEIIALEEHPWFMEDLWLPGPLEDRKESEEPLTLKLSDRSLELKKFVTGRTRWEGLVGSGVLPTETTHKYWIDQSIPFGVARAHQEFKFAIQGLERIFKYDLDLEHVADNAKSTLPDHW